ncbi:alcohol dehydrogenase catalytic domain-containing protein [Streptomyces sp. TRM66268-LWL]|uniref:Alcohol dehydrogenase catalytic domain-containing protein n=1 Tax=Streptomyces polyasparticus TaxID=2767826 RepID=A0ABR7SUA2_9ACTN|nr:alcohol dehydrogenase catalytic domain-containing protein [Streptomyces polyasparticus]MBC9719077.1 alcohol dehydrogenase catalytic domain-containing protein [Streptomyces polyasparticus]
MKALVYQGPGQRSWQDVEDPKIQDPGDAIVQVDAVTICGTDLHILQGDVPAVQPGRILGHEAVGTVRETGPAIGQLRAGQRVLISCISACGHCAYCRRAQYGQCRGGGGWILGHRIDGVQAEFVRVPFADTSVHPLPDSVSSQDALLFADILPTAYEVGVLNGRVSPGDTVVVVGAGPIGLATILTARLFSPSRIIALDPAASRRDAAARHGAHLTLDPGTDDVPARIGELTEGLGADTAIEAVGRPETFELCTQLVRPGGRVANVGVHGRPATLHLEDLWIKNLTLTTGLVDTFSTSTLLRMLAAGQLPVTELVTHHYALTDMQEAYDVFERPDRTGALKVALTAR